MDYKLPILLEESPIILSISIIELFNDSLISTKMGCFRYSGNIPKERQIFNASTLSGIEYSLKSLARDDSYINSIFN